MQPKKHTVVALMQDRPGVLARAVSLFRRRGFNIDSLTVGHTETPNVSRMTVVVDADAAEQVIKQLYRLVDVLKVSDVTYDPTVEREMAMIKVHCTNTNRAEIITLTDVFNAKVVDVAATSMVLEMTGSPDKVENFIEVIKPYGIKEMMRTGRIAMVRGKRSQSAGDYVEETGNGAGYLVNALN